MFCYTSDILWNGKTKKMNVCLNDTVIDDSPNTILYVVNTLDKSQRKEFRLQFIIIKNGNN